MSALGARRVRRVLPALAGLMFCIAAGPAESQSNLDAGKSPEQIFSDTCSACHHGPHGLKQTTAQFLRQHYTTGARQAAAMAAYLEKAATEPPPAPVQPFRRPSESVEIQPSANGSTDSPSTARAAASTHGFEE
jgi:mono/diheme cytochrome c family protein